MWTKEQSRRWGAHKGWQEGEEGEGSIEGGVHSLTIWIYCFTNGGEGWRTRGGERVEDAKVGVMPSSSLVNPKAETLPDLTPKEVILPMNENSLGFEYLNVVHLFNILNNI